MNRRRTLPALFVAALALTCLPTARAVDSILIGVISPIDGKRQIGLAHEQTIQFAHSLSGGRVKDLPLEIDTRSDDGNPQKAVEVAKDLVRRGAVAILGPVDSSSTRAVLEAALNVPVISALSSATSLTQPNRDPWFFRMTLSDRERMRQYVNTLKRKTLLANPTLVLFDGQSEYGKGLKDDLAMVLGAPDDMRSWHDANIPQIAAANPPFKNIFVLGSGGEAVLIARQIESEIQSSGGAVGAARYFFVGDDPDLRKQAPPGSITIGEPTILDPVGTDLEGLLRGYVSMAAGSQDMDSFLVTAFEAYVALTDALGYTLDDLGKTQGGLPARSVDDMRDALRKTLDGGRKFPSIQPWRRIRFESGEAKDPPPLPVYAASLHLDAIDVPVPKPFLEVIAPSTVGYLQGPVTFEVRAHGIGEVPPVYVTRDGGARVDTDAPVVNGAVTKVTFYPLWTGTYQLTSSLPITSTSDGVQVALSGGYLIAFVGALVGALLFAVATASSHKTVSWTRVICGVLTGCVLAVLEFHRGVFPIAAMLPTFTTNSLTNAFCDGLAGGWVGPGVLIMLIGKLIPGGSPLPPSEPQAPHAHASSPK